MLGEHSVVLGASMAGLLAARVLSDAYRHVTVVERDVLPDGSADRRGVPQGRHAHALLSGGARILDELFPGFLAELDADRVPVFRDMAEAYFVLGGHQLGPQEYPLSIAVYQPSRAHLEHRVRARVRALPNVEITDRSEAVGLIASTNRDRVIGVRILRRGADAEETLDTDLVVDATGRASRTTSWLPAMGYPLPAENQVSIQVRYVTRRLRLAEDVLGRAKQVVIGAVPERPTVLVLLAQENGWWMLSLSGYGSHHPPTDPRGFLDFAQAIAPRPVFDAIMDAEPLDQPVAYRFPANLRRRYERMPRFPAGLLAFGDAICSFNPIYGQGMTIAALQAVALRECLAKGDGQLARRFFRATTRPIDLAWQTASAGDLALPEVAGPRPLALRALTAFSERVLAAAEDDY